MPPNAEFTFEESAIEWLVGLIYPGPFIATYEPAAEHSHTLLPCLISGDVRVKDMGL
jgi:hypothetical protein